MGPQFKSESRHKVVALMEEDSLEEEVERLYHDDQLSTWQIAALIGIAQSKVLKLLAGVPKRSKSQAAAIRFEEKTLHLQGSQVDLAYLIGVYLGDGCLYQFPRTELLDIACDAQYTNLIARYQRLVEQVFGKSPSLIASRTANCVHIRLYGKGISAVLGFETGPKRGHDLHIPDWIRTDSTLSRWCLRGLFETDGYLHQRRGRDKSVVLGFSNTNQALLDDVKQLLCNLGYNCFRRNQTSIDCWLFEEASRLVADIGFDKS